MMVISSANMTQTPVQSWLYPTSEGLYCEPGQFFIDPRTGVDRAVITHGHSDHARANSRAVLGTAETIAVMKARYGEAAGGSFQALAYGETLTIDGVSLRLVPAGHILGSAQVVLEWAGKRAVISGDYKREADPTCAGFELVTCDVFVTEATFGLPVFHHEPAEKEARRLLASLNMMPERTHLLGAYSLGKAQRMIAVLRELGYGRPIYLHGAMVSLCTLYQQLGVSLGTLIPVNEAGGDRLAGEIVLAPPSALNDRWSRRLADPLTVFASGWMRVRGRARQRGVELPLVVSDHADWEGLVQTIIESEAEEIWVTHGRDDALVHQIGKLGRRGRALALVGYEDEDE